MRNEVILLRSAVQIVMLLIFIRYPKYWILV